MTRVCGEKDTYVALQNTRERFALLVRRAAKVDGTSGITSSVAVLTS